MARAGIFETLELLHDTEVRSGKFIKKVEEQVEQDLGRLTRYTRLHVEIPEVTDAPAEVTNEMPFVYVLRAPRRGDLWTVRDLDVNCTTSCRTLGHEEHVLHCGELIFARFWSLVLPWVHGSGGSASRKDFERRFGLAYDECKGLMEIPRLEPADAQRRLKAHFTETGRLAAMPRLRADPVIERRLYKLCQTLAERYFVCVAFECDAGQSVVIDYTVEDVLPDVDLNYKTHSSGRSRLRIAFGAAPTALCFHAPLARATPSYDVRLTTTSTAYVHDQMFLERDPAVRDEVAYRAIPEGPETHVKTWRQPAGTSTAHMFLAHGNGAARRVYVGIKVFERLPGSTGRAAFIGLSAFGVCTVLALARWISRGLLAGNAAALVAAALGLIAFGADAMTKPEPNAYVSVTSRVSQLATSALLFFFAMWLLVPTDVGHSQSGFAALIGRVWVKFGWIVLIALLGMNMIWVCRRFYLHFDEYTQAVPRARIESSGTARGRPLMSMFSGLGRWIR